MNITKVLFYLSGAILLFIFSCTTQQPVVENYPEYGDSVSTDTSADEMYPEETPVYRASRTRLHDLIHTRLEVSFDWERQRLNGTAVLQLRPYFYPQDHLILDARNFEIHDVKMIKGVKENNLKYFYDGTQLFVTLDTTYQKEQDYFVKIIYTAKPAERETQGGEAITSDQGLYFINPAGNIEGKPRQVWTQGETESSSCWFPTIDAPNERTTQEVFITVEDKMVTLSNGVLVYSKKNGNNTRTDYWKMDKPHAPYLFMIAAGDFAVVTDKWKDVPLYYYIEPEYAPYAKSIFGRTPEMMGFFSDMLGVEYPWPKYAQIVVRDFVTGAMENTTATVFYEELLVDDRELADYNHDDIIAHELFHQWFGDLVTCESWSNLPLNEGFANYSEYLWKEYKFGAYEANLHALGELDQYLEEAQYTQVDLIRFNFDDPDDMFDNHSYAKAGLVLHMLRKQVGDEAFFASLRHYLDLHKYSSTEIHDLRQAFEDITGEDLNWFFNQWFMDSGHPQLSVEDWYEDGMLKIKVKQVQDLQTTPLYQLPLYIDVFNGSQIDRFSVLINKVEQIFEFSVPREPDLVVFDGEQQLLAETSHSKEMAEYIFQYYHVDGFYPKFESLDTLSLLPYDSLARGVLLDALDDKFWYFRQMAVNAFEDYTGPDMELVSTKIEKIARNDSSALVRADAVNILFGIRGTALKDLYKQLLSDTSYSVAGTALYAFIQSAPEEMPEIVKKFEQENNLYVVIPLASYFIDRGDLSRYDWFISKIKKMKWEGLWYMLQYFGEFLMNAPETMQRQGVVLLEEFARNNDEMYVKLAAYRGLGLLTDLSGVPELLLDIKAKEKDEYLKNLYESIP